MPEDLFSSPSRSSESTSTQEPTTPRAARYVLPKDIGNSVRHLSDRDLDLLAQACIRERKRRGEKPAPPVVEQATKPSLAVGAKPVPLTTAQVGAVRAAFKAGVKPPAIARQFRLSKAQVREALSPKTT